MATTKKSLLEQTINQRNDVISKAIQKTVTGTNSKVNLNNYKVSDTTAYTGGSVNSAIRKASLGFIPTSALKSNKEFTQNRANEAKSKLTNYLEKSGVSLTPSGTPSNLTTYKNKSITENKYEAKSPIQIMQENAENKKRYDYLTNEDTLGSQLEKNAQKTQNEASLATYKYDYQKAQEDFNEQQQHLGKVGNVVLGTARNNLMTIVNMLDKGESYTDENGRSVMLPSYSQIYQSMLQSKSGLVGNAIAQIEDQSVKQVVQSIPLIGQFWYNIDAITDKYNNAVLNGMDDTEALTYSVFETLIETEYEKHVTGGNLVYRITGKENNGLEGWISKKFGKLLKNDIAGQFIGSGASNAFEEFTENFIDLITKNKLTSDKEEILTKENLEDAIYAGVIGGLTGITTEAGLQLSKSNNQLVYDKVVNDIKYKPFDGLSQYQNGEITQEAEDWVNNYMDNYQKVTGNEPTSEQVENAFIADRKTKIDKFLNDMEGFRDKRPNIEQDKIKGAEIVYQTGKYIVCDENMPENISAKEYKNLYGDNVIAINPNKENPFANVMLHELTHLFGSDATIKTVVDFMKNHKDKNDKFSYENAVEIIEKNYGKFKTQAELDEEVTAYAIGQLIGSDEFLQQTTVKEPSLMKKAKDMFNRIGLVFSGNTSEDLFIRTLQARFNEDYRNANIREQSQDRYMFIKPTTEEERQATKMQQEGKTAEEIFRELGMLKNNQGKWKIEISDKDARINEGEIPAQKSYYDDYIEYGSTSERGYVTEDATIKDFENLDQETVENEYIGYSIKLKDLITHENLWNSVDEETRKILDDCTVEIVDNRRGTYGYYDSETNTISLTPLSFSADYGNGNVVNSNVRNVLLHEMQHLIQDAYGYLPGSNQRIYTNFINGQYMDYTDELAEKFMKEQNMTDDDWTIEKEIEFNDWCVEKSGLVRAVEELKSVVYRTKEYDGFKLDKNDLQNQGMYFYLTSEGEIEARLVEKRSNMSTDELRLDTTPIDVIEDARTTENLRKEMKLLGLSDDVEMEIIKGSMQERTPDLLAIHGITIDNFKQLMRENYQMPMPSIAITNNFSSYNTHFDMSDKNGKLQNGVYIIFGKDTIDPKNTDNKVFTKDAWTTTRPENKVLKNNGYENTPEGALQYMLDAIDTPIEDGIGYGSWLNGQSNKQLTTMEEIQEYSKNLLSDTTYIAEGGLQKLIKANRTNEAIKKISDMFGIDDLRIAITVSDLLKNDNLTINNLMDALQSQQTVSTLDMITNFSDKISLLSDFVDSINALKEVKSAYMEAKPQRMVDMLDEAVGIILPKGAIDESYLNDFRAYGLKVVEYEEDKKNRNKEKSFEEFNDAKFQKNDNEIVKYFNELAEDLGVKKSKDQFVMGNYDRNYANKKIQEKIAKRQTEEGKKTKKQLQLDLATDKGKKKRQSYKSMQNSDKFTEQEKEEARILEEADQYIPDSNEAQMNRAKQQIGDRNIDDVLKELNSFAEDTVESKDYDKRKTRLNVTEDNIAKAEVIREQYAKEGNVQKIQEVEQTIALMGTEAGRTLQAMKLIYRQTPVGKVAYIQRVVDKMNNQLKADGSKQQYTFTDDMKNRVLNGDEDSMKQVMVELGQQVTADMKQQIDAWRYFAMLSSPTTHLRNIFGNWFMYGTQRAKNTIKGALEDVFIKDGEKTASARFINKNYKTFAEQDFKSGEVDAQLGIGSSKYSYKNDIKEANRMFKTEVLEKTVGKMENGVMKLLEKEDAKALEKSYKYFLASYLSANKIDLSTMDAKTLNKARYYAVQQAKEATFHQDSKLAQTLQTFEDTNLATKLFTGALVPFKKTPINVAKTGLQYSPLGLATAITKGTADLKSGKINVDTYIDNLSKGLTGTGIAFLGFMLASAGYIKTDDDDEDKEYYEEDAGKQSYSVQIGDLSISLDWISPVGIPFFMGAELYKQMGTDENGDLDIDNVTKVLNTVSSTINPLSEMTMLSGLVDTLNSLKYSGTSANMFETLGVSALKTYVNQFTPSVLGKIAKSTDEYERSTTATSQTTAGKFYESVRNSFMSKIPGLRQKLAVKTDVWGNELKQIENPLLRTANNLFNPATVKTIRSTEVDDEIDRVYEATGESTVIPDTYLDKKFTFNDKDYVLSESEYATYKQTLGKENYAKLKELFNSSDYKSLSDEDKAELISKVYGYDKNVYKYEYAQYNDIDAELSSTYQTAYEIDEAGGSVTDYYVYKAKLPDEADTYQKASTLKGMSISKNDKSIIYENAIASNSQKYLYEVLRNENIDIDKYLDFVSTEFEGQKNSDGETISGSKKKQIINYLNSSSLTYNQKLLIGAKNFSLSDSQQTLVANLIVSSGLTSEEKQKLFKSLSGFKVKANGTVTW